MLNSPNSCPNHPFRKHLISCEPSEKSKHKTEYFCILCKQPVANVGYVPPRNSPTEIHNTYLLDNSSVISDHNGEWSPKLIDKSRSLDQIDYVKQYYDSLPLAKRKIKSMTPIGHITGRKVTPVPVMLSPAPLNSKPKPVQKENKPKNKFSVNVRLPQVNQPVTPMTQTAVKLRMR